MKTPAPFLCAILFFSFFSFAYGQHRWSAEFRPDVNFPTTTFDRSDLTPGFGFEAAIDTVYARLGAYAGWGYNAFTPDDSDVDGIQPRDIDLTGYTFGLQFIHPIRGSSLSYLIRVGRIYSISKWKMKMGMSLPTRAMDWDGKSVPGFSWIWEENGIYDLNWATGRYQGIWNTDGSLQMSFWNTFPWEWELPKGFSYYRFSPGCLL